MKASEHAHPAPLSMQTTWAATYKNASRGFTGPIKTSFAAYFADVFGPGEASLRALGLKDNMDAGGGDGIGITAAMQSIDPVDRSRNWATNVRFFLRFL